ncbi:hypothetical protein [Streptomyces sp. NPDC057301]|uniref:hypothetical protein n=1 Tax=Streptomyces sp. NPDC057301 TaxID=3346093 RepID=UPI003637A38F
MTLTTLIISIVAALFAGASALYARRQAQSALAAARIEEDRRLDELIPLITCTMEAGPGTYAIAVTLESQRPLTSCQVLILDDRVAFTEFFPKRPSGPDVSLAEFGPLEPGIVVRRPAFVSPSYRPSAVRCSIGCKGARGRRWTLTKMIDIPSQPPH